MKKRKLPPYVALAMIEIRNGIYDNMESVTDIILNNIAKREKTNNKKIQTWSNSMQRYWQWVLDNWIATVNESKKLTKTDKKVFLDFINMRLSDGSKRKSN